jgi:hypothetical protein
MLLFFRKYINLLPLPFIPSDSAELVAGRQGRGRYDDKTK